MSCKIQVIVELYILLTNLPHPLYQVTISECNRLRGGWVDYFDLKRICFLVE